MSHHKKKYSGISTLFNSAITIFKQFLLLGVIAFGGPVAHIGYFRRRFVDELAWLDDAYFGQLLALCQFLPGPSSSQLGFAIGYHRGGIVGALAAFVGFTAPSFIIMFCLAIMSLNWLDETWMQQLIHGLKLLAVIVVADAVISMFKSFCQTNIKRMLALVAVILLIIFPSSITQIGLLFTAALYGYNKNASLPQPSTQKICINYLWLAIFCVILIGLVYFSDTSVNVEIMKEFFFAGTLVFGGGHVVLPLLQHSLIHLVDGQLFLAGYGFSQLIPGPMFTLSTFIGASTWQGASFFGALMTTLAVFIPGFLLLLSTIKHWHLLCERPKFNEALQMINACVVGVLAAAWVQPVVVSSILSMSDVFIALGGFYLLKIQKWHLVKVSLVLFLIQGVKFSLESLI
ncbi:chromate efflux transporter [Parashewanella spongiae]|uniref:Chromate efflux transporter n=1 Tax=Parashewanella spongiae TaxID=342950 RepID=A0A3A6UG65_9GAMM|nr:chromate efflux transporter [Parashewanella spongiae]MCL1079208.1 chromate efflux transporter [Parashewanella spongiae]RJY17867.1 chromate efflux transporter [Parashewanella spongiae]